MRAGALTVCRLGTMHAEPSPTAPGAGTVSGTTGVGPVDGATLDRFAELIVRFAANVQRGQIVAIGTEPGKLELTRAVAAAAYRAGAKYVDVSQFDLHLKRAHPARGRGDARLRAAVAGRADPRAGRASRGEHRADRAVGAGPAQRPRP